MEKTYYVFTCKPAYLKLLEAQLSMNRDLVEADDAYVLPRRIIVAITQGGFGQDVIDDERQTKERFLDFLFHTNGIDLPRSEESFDEYFDLEEVDEFIDLDEEM